MAKLPVTPSALPGTMEKTAKTGTWKAKRPVYVPERCNGCLACWFFCPDSAIAPADGKIALRLDVCKGCGICAVECPQQALRMEAV